MKTVSYILIAFVFLSACNSATTTNGKEGNIHQRKEFYGGGKLKETVNIDANGLKQDTLKIYYKDGKLNHIEIYRNDTLNGPFITYHKNGKIWVTTMYKNGVKNGYTANYYQNGGIKWCGNFVNGSQEGTFTYNYLSGKPQSKEVFKNNRTLYKVTYDSLNSKSTEYFAFYVDSKKTFSPNEPVTIKAYAYSPFNTIYASIYTDKINRKNMVTIKQNADSSYTHTFAPQKPGNYKLYLSSKVEDAFEYFTVDTIIVR